MEIFFAGVIFFFCAFIQTVAGFAFALFAMPLLLLCGFDLPDSVVLSMTCSLFQRLLVVHKYRNCIDWKPLFSMYPMAIVGLIIGIVALKKAALLDQDTIKMIFGVIILLTVGMRLFVRVEPRDSVPFRVSALAAFLSGLLSGFANIGGPPMVFWILAHKWSNNRLRATIPAFTLLMIPVQVILLWISFGLPVLIKIAEGFLFFPIILAAVFAGNLCSHKLSTNKVRIIIIILLTITGLSYIIYPLIKKYCFYAHN